MGQGLISIRDEPLVCREAAAVVSFVLFKRLFAICCCISRRSLSDSVLAYLKVTRFTQEAFDAAVLVFRVVRLVLALALAFDFALCPSG